MERAPGESSSEVNSSGDREDPIVLFKRLHKKAQALGLSDEQISHIKTLKRIQQPKFQWRKYFRFCLGAIVVLTAIFVSCLSIQFPMSKKYMLSVWFSLTDRDMEKDQCVLEATELLVDTFRPPVECSMCRDVTEVDHIKDISPKEFEEKYAYSGRPVVITDGAKNWTATQTFTWDFFRSIYTEDSPALENVEQNCQFFPYKTEFRNLREVFNMSDERSQMKDGSPPWYIGWSNCDSSAANILRQHYTRPYFLPRAAESSKTDWIFMGSPGYGAHMHIDHVGNPSWQAQIAGTKKWMLEPPPECYRECVQHLDVTLHPGEIIVLDTNSWYHATLNVGDDLSICIGSEYD